MPTLGQTMKAAREAKKVTASQAAAATRMKIQHVEALERDDFSQMAAPMYSKGFIRIYAEYLGLDPFPLIAEYMELHAPKERPPLVVEDKPRSRGESALKRALRVINWPEVGAFLKRASRYIVIAIVALLAVGGFMRLRSCRKAAAPAESVSLPPPPPPVPAAAAKPAPAVSRHALPVIMEPPEPYADTARGGNPGL